MTTPLNDALDSIATIFAALTPPSRTSITYHRISHAGEIEAPGFDADRGFWFDVLGRTTIEERNNQVGLTDWEVGVFCLLLQSPEADGREASQESQANELNLLARALERATVWPAGVLEVETTATGIEVDDDSRATVLSIGLTITTEETD